MEKSEIYFPGSHPISIAPLVDSFVFNIGDKYETQVIISEMKPGALLPAHAHDAVQVGLCLSGQFLMEVDGKEKQMDALQNAYVTEPGVSHGARNVFSKNAITLDIKCLNPETLSGVYKTAFLVSEGAREIKTGIKMRFFSTPWCEIMISEIPKGAVMPEHKHKNRQLGIALDGQYKMNVNGVETLFKYGKIYYAPSGVRHSAYNPFEEKAISLNVFFPPRYTKMSESWNQKRTVG